MSRFYSDLQDIVAKLSTGPTAAIVVEASSSLRYAIVQPYNFYFINNKVSVIMLLSSSRLPPNSQFNAVEFFSTTYTNDRKTDIIIDGDEDVYEDDDGGDDQATKKTVRQRYVVSNVSFSDMAQYFKNKYTKIILFKDVKARTIEEILNKMLELGVFTIK